MTGLASGSSQPAGEPLFIASRGALSATFSADFTGGPVEVRIVAGTNTLRPGKASFNPTATDSSRSFTFVAPGGETAKCRGFFVEWRSPSAEDVTFHRGDLVVTYDHAPKAESACPVD